MCENVKAALNKTAGIESANAPPRVSVIPAQIAYIRKSFKFSAHLDATDKLNAVKATISIIVPFDTRSSALIPSG